MAFARALLRSDESAAAYQIDVSTNRLMADKRIQFLHGLLRAEAKASAIMESFSVAMSEACGNSKVEDAGQVGGGLGTD